MDAVRETLLIRDGELGSIQIADLMNTGTETVCLRAFLPGNYVQLPGDTPKTEPDECIYFSNTPREHVNVKFEEWLRKAKRDGWTLYDRNTGT